MATVYVSPTGSGDKSGSSAANALPVTSLDKAIHVAGPGGSVLMLADQGSYNLTTGINITHGGADGAPVTVKGVDSLGNEMNIQVNGTRMDEYVVGGAAGNECFKLLAGADNLVFENMNFANVATAFRAGADISNIVIEDMFADNVRRFFEDIVSGSNTSATVSGLTIRDVEVHGFSKGVVRLQYDSNNILIENVYGDSERQDGDGIAIGIHLAGTVHGAVIRQVTMENAQSSTTDYWNGDGFATERGVYDVTFEDTIARGNADGGYDLKSNDTTLIRAIAEGNGRNFRLWDEATLIDCVGLDPHKWGGSIGGQFQIQVMDGANVTVTGGIFSDSGRATAVAVNDGGGTLSFVGTQFLYDEGARLTLGSDIFGIDPTLVAVVSSTGTWSTNGATLAELANAENEGSEPAGETTEQPPAEDVDGDGDTAVDPTDQGSGDGGFDTSVPTDETQDDTDDGAAEPGDDSSTGETSPDGDGATSGGTTAPPVNEPISYVFDIPGGSGVTTITLDANDMLVTNRAISGERDGIIQFGSGGLLHLEQTRRSLGDQSVAITGAEALRYLGNSGGKHYYADAAVRPNGATEGSVENDALYGSRRADSFFFDTALGIKLGSDAITNFATDDRIVTTKPLLDSDGDGLITAGANGAFRLGDAPDTANQLKLVDGARASVTTLQFGGTLEADGVTYYVYGLPGTVTAPVGGTSGNTTPPPAPIEPDAAETDTAATTPTGGATDGTGSGDTQTEGTDGGPTSGTTDEPSGGETGGATLPPADSGTGTDTADGTGALPATERVTHVFDIPGGLGHRTIELDSNDMLVTNRAISGERDGIIQFGSGGLLHLEQTRRSLGDQSVAITGAEALRYLGNSGGKHYYADAAVRPNGATEGSVGNDALYGSRRSDSFFFDTALGIKLGSDAITNFAADDRIVTTKPLLDSDGDGLITTGADGTFQLGDAPDPANQLKLIDSARAAVTALEYDGTRVVEGVAYYFYSLQDGPADLTI